MEWGGSPLICVLLEARTVDGMAVEMGCAATAGADVVEIGLDRLTTFHPRQDLEFLLSICPLPAIVSYRPAWEGGEYEGDEESRLRALELAVKLGAHYVDVELQVAYEFIKCTWNNRSKVIVSSHNHESTPSREEMGDLVATMQALGAHIVKLVTTAKDITDVARMFQVVAQCQIPMIGLVMSEKGDISRLLCGKFGGYLTYAALNMSAGQPSIDDLLHVYKIRRVGIDTKVFGVIGNPVAHSRSPLLHNALFQSVGFDGVYVPLLVDDPEDFLRVYSSPDFSGFSVGIPHKECALECCDELDPVAKQIGAVNTIIRRSNDGKLIGYNTDCMAAISAIEDAIRGSQGDNVAEKSLLHGKTFVVIGAGGAARALAYGAKEKGAKVVIANRTYDRARKVASSFGCDALSLAELRSFRPSEGTAILANATSVGMQPNVDDTPLPKRALSSYSVVFDAVYTPKMTRLLREACECGAAVVSGYEMFINQAMMQFQLFTGSSAPDERMRRIITGSISSSHLCQSY